MSLEQAKTLIQQAQKAMEDESLDFTSDLTASITDLLSDIDYWIVCRDEVEGGDTMYDDERSMYNSKHSRGV